MAPALGHDIGDRDAAFVSDTKGADIVPFLYLGAKHMVTGYDHLLFVLAVILVLQRLRDMIGYVTLFSIGHSLTLLVGVAFEITPNANIIDAIIGLSVAYIAFDNLGGFKSVFGVQPNRALAVFIFGMFHGFGLATSLFKLGLNEQGLIPNLLAFNVGVELGQFAVLGATVGLVSLARRLPVFLPLGPTANAAVLTAGFVLAEYQIAGFFYGEQG